MSEHPVAVSTPELPANILRLELRGEVSAEVLNRQAQHLMRALETHNSVHLLLDIRGLGDLNAPSMVQSMTANWKQWGSLRRLRRIAIVSDKRWPSSVVPPLARWIPFTEVKVFDGLGTHAIQDAEHFLAQSDAAAQHAASTETDASIVSIRTSRDDLLAFEYRGHIRGDDIDVVMDSMRAAMARHDQLDLFVRLKDFRGFDPSILFRGSVFSLKLAAIRKLRRYAVVGPSFWMKWLIGGFDSLIGVEMRTFDPDDEASAWRWLGEAKPESINHSS